MIQVTMLKNNINNDLWPRVIFAMIYIKNNKPINALLQNLSPYKASTNKIPDLSHL